MERINRNGAHQWAVPAVDLINLELFGYHVIFIKLLKSLNRPLLRGRRQRGAAKDVSWPLAPTPPTVPDRLWRRRRLAAARRPARGTPAWAAAVPSARALATVTRQPRRHPTARRPSACRCRRRQGRRRCRWPRRARAWARRRSRSGGRGHAERDLE